MAKIQKKERLNFSLGVGGFIHWNKKVLLVRHKGDSLWTIPSGYLEPGESIEDTVKREVFEETGLVINTSGLLSVRQLNNKQSSNIWFVLYCNYISGKINPDINEIEEAKFYSIKNALLLPLTDITRKLLGRANEGKLTMLSVDHCDDNICVFTP